MRFTPEAFEEWLTREQAETAVTLDPQIVETARTFVRRLTFKEPEPQELWITDDGTIAIEWQGLSWGKGVFCEARSRDVLVNVEYEEDDIDFPFSPDVAAQFVKTLLVNWLDVETPTECGSEDEDVKRIERILSKVLWIGLAVALVILAGSVIALLVTSST